MAVKPKYYETFYLVRPDINDEELSAIQDKINKSISSNDGETIKSEKWDERELAYPIADYKKGIYYIQVYKALPNVVSDIEKNLRFHSSEVLRFITVKIDEDQAIENQKVQKVDSSISGGAQENG